MEIQRALILDSSKTTQAITSSLLGELDIACDIANNESDVWGLIKDNAEPYHLLLIARAALGRELRVFVSRLRALRHYHTVPLILLINDKGEDQDIESFYAIGFTQVFSRKEFSRLRDYLLQAKSRNTFEKARQNKVVIIEDDLAQQLTVQAILEENYCECFCFKSAEEALLQASQLQPHVLVSDFFLDGKMTALDLVLAVKNPDHPWRHVPIVVMTGLDDPTRKYELVRSGANDYIAKPIDPLDLSVRVENLIRYKHLLDTVEAQKKEMQFLAMHDPLTELHNRYFVAEQVIISITEAKRHRHPYAIIVIDIDHFKSINDQHGHDAGDKVLKAVGYFLQRQVRENDVVARMGGEEFLLLLSHCDLNKAVDKAKSLRAGLEKLNPGGLTVTASFGVAELNDELDNFDKLFKAADIAVYRAKSLGRNRVEVAPLALSRINNG